MDPELQTKYFTVLSNLQKGDEQSAQQVVSDILAQKLAAQLQTYNQQQLEATSQSLESEQDAVNKATETE